jgi:uncharacterized membrane protein
MASPARLFGLLLAGSGVAHFAAPALFEPVTKVAFPEDTEQWTYRNGATEVAIGLALAGKRTRKLGTVGLLGYVGFLGSRVLGGGK